LFSIRHIDPASSSAECEREFSLMNDIARDDRNSLLTATICSLIFLKLNSPEQILILFPLSSLGLQRLEKYISWKLGQKSYKK